MTRVLFAPISIVAGLIAGLFGKKLFDFLWARIDDEEAPKSSHLEVVWWKVLLAAGIQGAIFRATRAVSDRGARLAFYRATGSWPGEEERDETK